MRAVIIPDGDGLGETLIIEGEIERMNPLEHLFEMHVNRQIIIGIMMLKAQGEVNESNEEEAREILARKAMQEWPARIAEITRVNVPSYLTDLLTAKNKKEQQRLLKGATMTTDQLLSFVCKAWEQGYSYSKYYEHLPPAGTDLKQLPHLFHREDDGSIRKIGQSSMSDGKLTQILDQRKVMVATFLDKGDDWHCFFATYRGLAGKENYKEAEGGQAHMHYISSKWGSVTRQQVIEGIRTGTYIASNVHIDLLDNDDFPPVASESYGSDTDLLPPLPVTGTGLPEPAWLYTSGSLYTHYYPANLSTAACGRYKSVAQVRAAWKGRNTLGKQQCPSCASRLLGALAM